MPPGRDAALRGEWMEWVKVVRHGVDCVWHLQGKRSGAHSDRKTSRRYNHAMQAPAPKIPWLAMVLIAGVAFAGGIGLSWWQGSRDALPAIDGLMWPDPPAVPDIALIRDDGTPFKRADLRGRWTLMFFGFTHCPDVCPTTLDLLAQVHTILKKSPPYGAAGQVVFVSVDPERDNPAQLAQYVHYFHRDFIGVTAPEAELKPLLKTLGVLFMKVAEGGPDYTVDHSAGIFFIDPAGRLVSVLTPPHTADAVIARFNAVSAFILGKS